MTIDEIVLLNIKALMSLKGLSQSALAKEAKVSKENLNRLFKGHRDISKANILPDLASALGVSVDFLKTANNAEAITRQAQESNFRELIRIIGILDPASIDSLLEDARDYLADMPPASKPASNNR